MNSRYLRPAIVLVILLPVGLWLLFIKFFGVNVVFLDSWGTVVLIEKLYAGSLTFRDLFALHNEHRIFFPKLIMLALAHLTHYNSFAEMLFSWMLVCMTMVIIWRMYTEDFGTSGSALTKFVPVCWLLFNLRQYDSILSGFQLQTYLCVAGSAGSIYLLRNTGTWRFVGAIMCGLVATFSFANGLLVWPVGAVFLLLSREKAKAAHTALWAAIGIAAWAVYLHDFASIAQKVTVFSSLKMALSALAFFVLNIGAPLAVRSSAVGMGTLLIACIIIVAIASVRHGVLRNTKWMALILFSLGSSALFTAGRTQLGLSEALTSRYLCFTTLGIVGVYMSVLTLYRREERENRKENYAMLFGGILSLIIVGIVSGYSSGLMHGRELHAEREQIAGILAEYEKITDESIATRPFRVNKIKKRAAFLKKHNLNQFHKEPPSDHGNKPH